MTRRAGNDAAEASFHDERRHFVLFHAGLGVYHRRFTKDGEDLGDSPIGNPDFTTVENEVSFFVVEHGTGTNRRRVRTASCIEEGGMEAEVEAEE